MLKLSCYCMNRYIGTDATIATHISTIQVRNYAVRNAHNQFEPTQLGLALVEGYNSMGYQLNKPQLRAVIEADCQRIAKGQANRADVVRNCLASMRECFLVCSREADKLDQAMRKYFGAKGAGGVAAGQFRLLQRNFSLCGTCSASMELRTELAAAEEGGGAGDEMDVDEEGGGGEDGGRTGAERRGRERGGGRGGRGRGRDNTATAATAAAAAATSSRYLFCTAETCKTVLNLPRGEVAPLAVHCAICKYQALSVRNVETNKEHSICPFCFRYNLPFVRFHFFLFHLDVFFSNFVLHVYSNPPPPPEGLEAVSEFR
jgi:hypothetical protein